MKLLLTGDLVINQHYSASEKISPKLKELFASSNCNIVNLEAPVTTSTNKIIKTGPHLKANEASTLEVMQALNIHIAALANNHIKDYDEQGVLDTIAFCKQNDIQPMGAGKNIAEASDYHVLQTNEGNIAVINIAENEWASATHSSAGANGMDVIKDTRCIQKAKQECDLVFVIVHGGHEYYNLPSPRMQEQYRFYAEQGADLVVGHHTHCISGHEVHQGTPIFYSLGNFLFTKPNPNEEWYTGLVLEVNVNEGKLTTQLHPVGQSKVDFALTLLSADTKTDVLARVERYSEIICAEGELLEHWREFVKLRTKAYASYWSPKVFIRNRYLKALLNKLSISFTNITGLAYFLNLMRCEAHHDLSQAVLEEKLRK